LGLFVLFGVVGHAQGAAAMFGYPSIWQFGADIVLLLLLLQNLNGSSAQIGNGPFWTLALEEQLYLLYFALLALRRRIHWRLTLVIVAAVTIAWRCAPLLAGTGVPEWPTEGWLAIGPSRWIEWALGALAVEAYLDRVRLPQWCYSIRVGLCLVALAVAGNFPGASLAQPLLHMVNDALFGVAFFVLINYVCRLEKAGRLSAGRVGTALASVGVFSYSLYLTHWPSVALAKQIALRLGLAPSDVGTLAMIGFRFVFAMVVAYAFYRIVELRAIRASRKLRQPDMVTAAASTG
jgi:peptidoglycan/LPS O-acetylase OafA/YrhL